MSTEPAKQITAPADNGAGPVIVRRLTGVADLLGLHRRAPERYPFLLSSAGQGRYDLLLAGPGECLQLDAAGALSGPGRDSDGDFLDALDRWFLRERCAPQAVPVPFIGGWFIYLGYELAAQIEPTLRLPPASDGPVACAVRVPAAVIVDREQRSTWLIAEADRSGLLADMQRDLRRRPPHVACPAILAGAPAADPDEAFLAAVAVAREAIARGEIYQANLSRRWRARLSPQATPADLLARLMKANPAPFSALALLGGLAIISSSPERLLRLHDGWAESRPIAGTRPRDAARDEALREELIGHPKERAEHIMLVDLERNDLGRICQAGSVEVNELMVLESYAHVHHIVSNVRGRLLPECPPGRALRAMFPGGTITGCPKIRCMQIIAELERRPRGVYTGSLGYLNRDGSGDFNILIRSFAVAGRELSFGAGGGIVADSEPRRELEETAAKAQGLLRALSL